MALETIDRHDDSILWPCIGYDRHGQPKVGALEELKVQWDTRRRELHDPQGNTIICEASAVVDRKIVVGSVMWKGTEADWYGHSGGTGSGSAGQQTELMEVVAYEEVQDIKGRNVLRTVGMARYRDTLPESA